MSELIKGMYSDLTCNIFKLQYDQTRTDEVIRNAGWFNSKGEKIGRGDLNIKDIKNIYKSLESDIFIILNENDSVWDLPSNLDSNAPGPSYVMRKARWVISSVENKEGFHNNQCYEIRNEITRSRQLTIKDDFEYWTAKRDRVFTDLSFEDGLFLTLKETPSIVMIDRNFHYGMDCYNLTNGQIWAVGTSYKTEIAAHEAARQKIHLIDIYTMRALATHLDSVEFDMISDLKIKYGEQSNETICRIVGEKTANDLAANYVDDVGYARLLGIVDGRQHNSGAIKGLPSGLYAFRII